MPVPGRNLIGGVHLCFVAEDQVCIHRTELLVCSVCCFGIWVGSCTLGRSSCSCFCGYLFAFYLINHLLQVSQFVIQLPIYQDCRALMAVCKCIHELASVFEKEMGWWCAGTWKQLCRRAIHFWWVLVVTVVAWIMLHLWTDTGAVHLRNSISVPYAWIILASFLLFIGSTNMVFSIAFEHLRSVLVAPLRLCVE